MSLRVIACELLLCDCRKAMSVNGSQTAKFVISHCCVTIISLRCNCMSLHVSCCYVIAGKQ